MKPITLNDNTFLYNETSLEWYLKDLGFDIEELKDALWEEASDTIEFYKEEADRQELIADGYYCNMSAAYNELDSIVSDLYAGKGTKAKIADKIRYILNCYF